MPKTLKIVLALVLLSLIGLTAFFIEQPKSELKNPWDPNTVKPFKSWYQINWQKQAVGWASLELQREKEQIKIIEEDFIIGRVQSQRMQFSFKRELAFSNSAPYTLLSIQIESHEPQLEVNKNILNDQVLTVTETRNGHSSQTQHPAVDYSLTDYLALHTWIENDKFRKNVLLAKEFNNDDYGLHYSRYQVLNEPDKSNRYFQIKHQLQNSDRLDDAYQSQANILEFDRNFKLLKRQRSNGMQFVASEGKVSINPEMQQDLYLQAGVAVDKPLGMVSKIRQLTLEFPMNFAQEFAAHPALITQGSTLILNKNYQYSPEQTPQVSHSHVKAKQLALDLIRPSQTPADKVEQLTQYVHEYIDYQTVPSSFEVDDILNNKIGDCTEHALLLSEMLNGVGIPARQVSGLIYLGDGKQRFGGHVWVEAFYDGKWHAVDPTWNLTRVTAAHIPLLVGANKSPNILQKASDWMFKVRSIQK